MFNTHTLYCRLSARGQFWVQQPHCPMFHSHSGVMPQPVRCFTRKLTSRHLAAVTASATQRPHVTVVGGGAAGLTAALFAAEEGAQVTVLERMSEAGKKILMSGGTRCNVLPMEVDIQKDFFSESPSSAVRAVFASWPLAACRYWLEDPEHGVGLDLLEEEETSKVFPASNSSREVRDKLVSACIQRGVVIKYRASLDGLYPRAAAATTNQPSAEQASVTTAQQSPLAGNQQDQQLHVSDDGPQQDTQEQSIVGSRSRRRGKAGNKKAVSPAPSLPSPGWVCRLADGSIHHTDRVVVCTGGLSFPLVGTDGTGHRVISALGVPLHAPYPALTPLTGPHPGKAQLAGLSLYNVDLAVLQPSAKKPRKSTRTGMLFTHKGYSGPAVLDVSHHVIVSMLRGGPQPALTINWTSDPPAVWEERLQGGGKALVSTILQRSGLRERLADALCEELGLADRKMSELRREERQALVASLTSYPLACTGHEGYKKAEVTGGGVPLTQVDTRTLEVKVLPGLHLAGEILDVFGRIGGFNFYWAWVSGRLAGRAAAQAALADQASQERLVTH